MPLISLCRFPFLSVLGVSAALSGSACPQVSVLQVSVHLRKFNFASCFGRYFHWGKTWKWTVFVEVLFLLFSFLVTLLPCPLVCVVSRETSARTPLLRPPRGRASGLWGFVVSTRPGIWLWWVLMFPLCFLCFSFAEVLGSVGSQFSLRWVHF